MPNARGVVGPHRASDRREPAPPAKVSLGYLNREEFRDELGGSDLSEFPTKLMPSM